jgi:hypothetical protein
LTDVNELRVFLAAGLITRWNVHGAAASDKVSCTVYCMLAITPEERPLPQRIHRGFDVSDQCC